MDTLDTHDWTDLTVLRCRKCRKCILKSSSLSLIANPRELPHTCNVWHVNVDALPDWIQAAVHQAKWTVGKLSCPYCKARLGGFNFLTCPKCPCGKEDAVHLSKSRVDHERKRAAAVHSPRVLQTRGSRNSAGVSSWSEWQNSRGNGGHSGVAEGIAEGCLPDVQTSCPAILRLIATSTPITPEPHCGLEPEPRFGSQAASPPDSSTSSSTHIPSGFCGISSLSCFGEASFRRLSDFAEVERIRVGEWPNPEPESLEQTSRRSLDVQSEALEGFFRPNEHHSSSGVPLPVGSGTQRQAFEAPAEDGMLPQVLFHETTRQPSTPSIPSQQTDRLVNMGRERETEEEDPESEDFPVSPRGLSAALSPLGSTVAAVPTVGEYLLSKREKNYLKSQRRKQRRRERWLQRQQEEEQQGLSAGLVAGCEQEGDEREREGHTCAVCLDVYFSPHQCQPCGHVFCEPCLRTLAKNRPGSTPCPLCRTVISHVIFQRELNQTAKTFFPKEYLSRKQTFQKTNFSKWPLPHCPKRFRISWGFHREGIRGAGRWHIPHRPFGLHTLGVPGWLFDTLDLRAWPFNVDLLIIYVYSIHWILAFLILCFVGYCFFF